MKEAFPPFSSLVVDIYGRCNLRCRFCPEGKGFNNQPVKAMPLSFFQQKIGPLLRGLKRLELFNWSEPLLHPDLFSFLSWSAEHNPALRLRLSTNGLLIDRDYAEKLVSSPVQSLTITLAAITREAYQDYHGVDGLEKVIHGMQALCQARREQKKSTPKIRLRYLRFPFNMVSKAALRKWAGKHLGSNASLVDTITIRDGYLCGTTLSMEKIEALYGIAPRETPLVSEAVLPKCKRAMEEPAVRADGAVFPCCALPYRDEYIMGFLQEASFEEIWNNPRYVKFRESFGAGENQTCKSCFFRFPKVPLKLDRHIWQRIRARLKSRK